MNFTVPCSSVIQNSVLLSITQGRLYHNERGRKMGSSVFPDHLSGARPVSGRCGFSGEYFRLRALTQASDQWSPEGLSKLSL